MLTFVLRNCLFPLYHVIMAFGRDPVLSQETSYRRSATKRFGGSIIFTVKGFTVVITFLMVISWQIQKVWKREKKNCRMKIRNFYQILGALSYRTVIFLIKIIIKILSNFHKSDCRKFFSFSSKTIFFLNFQSEKIFIETNFPK